MSRYRDQKHCETRPAKTDNFCLELGNQFESGFQQSYELTSDETEQLRQLLGCSGADNDKVDEVCQYHFYIEANGRYRHGVIVYDSLFTENMYDDLIEFLCDDVNGIYCQPSELIIKSLTRL